MAQKLDIERARELWRELHEWRKGPSHEVTAELDRRVSSAMAATNLPALLDELEAARAVVEAVENYRRATGRASIETLESVKLSKALTAYHQTIGKGGAR